MRRNLTSGTSAGHGRAQEYDSLADESSSVSDTYDDSPEPNFRQVRNQNGNQAADFSSAANSAAPSLRGSSVPYSPDFSRYPFYTDGAAGSNTNRVSSLSQQSYMSQKSHGSYASSYAASEQDQPFLVSDDSSPFGGYPASNFPLHLDEKEDDDYMHNPDPILDAKFDKRWQGLDRKGFWALVGFLLFIVGLMVVMIILPVLAFTGITARSPPQRAAPNNRPPSTHDMHSDYDYGLLSCLRKSLVDPDTPQDALKHTARDGSSWDLVFSDEFNLDGRTFYPGEDQFWTAQDFHYAATTDLEWYSPDAAITVNGTLQITLDAFYNNNLNYRSAMIQSWNKLCFTQGYIEVQVRLPGSGKVPGLWPGIWTLGNLARPGFLASSDGLWPYSYDSCDAGITPNQSSSDGLNYLPGQRLAKCVCPGEDHPNVGVGRGAPEIDILEGTVNSGPNVRPNGLASLSYQLAPMDVFWQVDYDFVEIFNKSVARLNDWTGGPFQQAVSISCFLNNDWYEFDGEGSFQSFGFEYLNNDENGYITWLIGDVPQATMYSKALVANGNVGHRIISKEPMSIIMNLGVSNSWTYINWPGLIFPSHFLIDHVRVYQPSNAVSVTCDPKGYPTREYIEKHLNVYSNPNLTRWSKAGYTRPKNSLMDGC